MSAEVPAHVHHWWEREYQDGGGGTYWACYDCGARSVENPETPAPSAAEVEALAERDLRRRLQTFIDSPLRGRCVVCGHLRHNELGYCQTNQCSCETGTSIGSLAAIILRDLPARHAAEVQAARVEAFAPVRALVEEWRTESLARMYGDHTLERCGRQILALLDRADGEAKA